jgi:cytochrome P450
MSQASLGQKAPQPEHVPDSLVYDFDLFNDPEFLRDPHRRALDLLQSAPPIFWTPRNKGHWILQSYDAVFEAARDVDSFSNEIVPQELIRSFMEQMPPGSPHIPQPFPINLDPPEHSKYRLPLQQVFSPKTINALKDDIRASAVELINKITGKGHCEFISAVAEPFPVTVFLKMLGLPVERMHEYRTLVKEMFSLPDAEEAKYVEVSMKITASMNETLLARKESPKNDIISLLWKTVIDDKPMTLDDMENYAMLLFLAGLDTVTNGIGHGIRHLAIDQALQTELRNNPALIPEAVEELLRRYSFVSPKRRMKRDTVFHGVTMKAEETAVFFMPSADLDSHEFPNAEKFDLQREKKSHIAFNAGPHRCLGSHLARLELQTVYEEVLARLPQFRLDDNNPQVYRGGFVVAFEQLNLRWD